ncbi:hypothetical protein SIID45300_03223 [Candidatus Magnetaquicoccaceae bacterium FCR-1]|uniref:6-hydroxymethylpterin diphosphokinase MptE-like domain-containing protein n=2 Tax=Candidatus Magnetaquiglobus chichijimensis TaxID=3141448 RepID=A0ABQ0CDT6_9PROT
MQDTTRDMSLGPILMNRFGERYLPSINQEAFSRVGSENLFQQQYGDFFTRENALYLIVGADSGLLIQWLCKRRRPEGSRFVFIELPETRQVLETHRLLPGKLPPELIVTTAETWLAEAEAFSLRDYFYLDAVFLAKSLAVIDGVHDGYAGLLNEVERTFGQYRLQVGQEIGNRVFMLKGLENLAENRFPAGDLHQTFQGRSAILLAGGPSLPESFPWIRAHRDHLTVLAVARVADQLKGAGIIPDLFFAIDPHDVIFHQSKGMLAFWRESVLINMYHLNPTLLGQWRGRGAFMGTLFPWECPCNPVNVSYPGITVGHQALGMAVDMGFETIVMAGFDLCFSREGFTHAAGSVEQGIGPYIARGDLMVETNGGWMAETRHDFLNAIPSLAALARYAATRNCRVINPSPGSARIEGIAHLPWESLIPQPTSDTARDRLRQFLPEETSTSRVDHYRAIEQELASVRGVVVKVKELAVEGIDCNDGLFGRRGKKPNFKFKKRMDEIEVTLDETYREASRLVKKWGLGAMLRLSRPDKERAWSDEEVERTGRLYYEIYRDNATSLIKQLDVVRQRIRMRMEEERNRPDFKQMVKQWREDGQPGRALVFLDRRGWSVEDLPESVRAPFRQLIGEYESLLDKTDHDYKRYILAMQSSPQEVRAKAQALFRGRERERLVQFAAGLEQSTLEERIDYDHLLRGYLAELDGDMDGAMRALRQVTHAVLLPDALRQMFTIALRQGDMLTAVAVSQRLSDLSFLHVPHHAELLRINGQAEYAAAIYEEYLKVVRKDFVSMVKLARTYLELGRKEQAKATLERILAEDPDNQAVRTLLTDLERLGVEGEA